MQPHRIYRLAFASVYPHYVAKVEKKGRTTAELHQVISWLTGYAAEDLARILADKTDFQTFFADAPALNPARGEVKGLICGIRVEEIEDPLMRDIRVLDKMIDELAKGRKMEKILRVSGTTPARSA